MNRRDFVRKLGAGAVAALGGWLAAGCNERHAGLLRDPMPPVFGPRRAGAAGVLGPGASAPAPRATVNPAEWVPAGGERRWQYVILHHSATRWGSAADFDRIHRSLGWDELGYHFVIGNGTGAPDGAVEIGGRWHKQKHGAHCKVAGHPEYNDFGIGVCLVGNFDQTRPTEAQMASLGHLVSFLARRYQVPRSRIYGHGQLKATNCPGRYFPYDDLFRRLY